MKDDTTHTGGCHCAVVKFEVRAPAHLDVVRCNCSICAATGFLHLIVGKDAFTLLSGEDSITTYTFNTGNAKHTFCSTCGIKSFYTPRSHPDGISINVNCLDRSTVDDMTITEFDGQNWEAARDTLD
ncbi:MAG TPA: GFA family protein [Sneathiellales bacterium]|nr:GFA family protein [Sneathiellales bacterium]